MKMHKEIYPIHASRLTLLGGEVKVLIWIPYEKASTNQDGSDFWGQKTMKSYWGFTNLLQKISQKLINQMLRYLFFDE